jgi:CHAT domain-containing protein
MRCRLLPLLLSLLFSVSLTAFAQTTAGTRPLDPGNAIEREISGGESHTYQLKLSVGQFIRVVVEQKGIDVSLTIVGPDGKQIIESDLTDIPVSLEPLSFEVKSSGTYQLLIRGQSTLAALNPPNLTAMELKVTSETRMIGEYRMRSTRLASLRGYYQVRWDSRDSASAPDRKRIEAEQLLAQAAAMTQRMEFQQSVDTLQQALVLWRETADKVWEGTTVRSIGINYAHLSSYQKAVEYAEQALIIARQQKDRHSEVEILNDLGVGYDRLANHDKSLEYFNQALAINREVKDRREEGVSLASIGWANFRLKKFERAIEYVQQALDIARDVKNRKDEADSLNILALAYRGFRQPAKAVEYGQQFLALERELQNRVGEAAALQNLSFHYNGVYQFEKGIEALRQALAIYRDLKARKKEVQVLKSLGDTYTIITRLDKAVESYELALPIYRELKDRPGEAFVLGPLANVFSQLGRQDKAIEYFQQALVINREIKSVRVSANLNGLGNAYLELGEYEKAAEYYEQARALLSGPASSGFGGMLLSNLGEAYQEMGRHEKAIEFAEQALTIYRAERARLSEPYALLTLGNAYRSQAQYAKATLNHEQSLITAREVKNRNLEGNALYGLMLDWQVQNRPSLAVFYGKQAVNLYQEIRSEIVTLESESQQSFVKSKEKVYRTLADLLIGQGRLPEAEQVIRMLKDEEYFEYIRRDSAGSLQTKKAQLTPEEAALEKRYREIAEQLAALGAERGTLMDKKSRTQDEEQRLAKLDADLVLAGNAFQKFMTQLEAELGSSSDANARAFALRESQGLMEDLRELGKGTVALYTLVAEDKYRLILTTADFQKGYEYPIKAADLNRKVLGFREALQNPKLDPLPMAQELYKILIGPAANDLAKAKVQTVMWSLDGVLRYVPVAALHDRKQYLVEQYQNVVFTPASQARLKDSPARNWNALGLGVSKAHGEKIPALPGVLDEMRGIIREETIGQPQQSGVLPGVVKLDEQFTQEALMTQLRLRPKVVHIASHFQFSPGNETKSSLLLGDGSFLSLAQIKSLPNIFGGVELLTLSACNTATGGSGANGREVEGFGVLAQRQGAKAVIASLWPVADRSTKELMQDFYRLREVPVSTSKAEALRQAQLKLLRGDDPQVAEGPQSERRIVQDRASTSIKAPFKTDPNRPYAHPYYWAPFILIGNWK